MARACAPDLRLYPLSGQHVRSADVMAEERHGWEIERDWIVMCPGVVPALHATISGGHAADESVIVQNPVYAPFFSS